MENFTSAMGSYLESEGQLCLDINKWPVDISTEDEKYNSRKYNQMKALESVDLVDSHYAEVGYIVIWGNEQKMKVKRYSLTTEASPFIKDREITMVTQGGTQTSKAPSLCWGEKRLGKIMRWERPVTLGTETKSVITYTYQVKNQAVWSVNPDIRAAFPSILNTLEGENKKEYKHLMYLNNKGWKATALY